MIDTNCILMVAETNQNYSRIGKKQKRRVDFMLLIKNTRPKVLVLDLDTEPQIEFSEEEKFKVVTMRILKEKHSVIWELAK